MRTSAVLEFARPKFEVDYDELKDLLDDDSVLVCDVREPEELQEGKIAGAINIPRTLCSCSDTTKVLRDSCITNKAAMYEICKKQFAKMKSLLKNRYLVFRKKIFPNFQKYCRQIVWVDLIKLYII